MNAFDHGVKTVLQTSIGAVIAAVLLAMFVELCLTFLKFVIFAPIKYFCAIGWQRTLLEVSAIVITAGSLYLARYPLGQFIKKAVVFTLRFAYYAIAVFFYGSAIIAALSLVSRVGDDLDSFLTSPIGIKPDAQVGEFGDAFYFLLAMAAVAGVVYLIARSLRRFLQKLGDESENLLTASRAPTTPALAALDVKASSE
jgi:hypothetical protein